MDSRDTKKIKPSQKILFFLRNERERGQDTVIVHRSEKGVKELRNKPLSDFEKQMEKIRLNDGVLDEQEFEDLDKVFDQVKKFIEAKHKTQFKPIQDEVRKYMDAYLQEKNNKLSKNAFNSYLNCKKIREEYMKNKLEKQQEKKRMREMLTKGIEIQQRKEEEVEMRERDKQLLDHFEQPYLRNPNQINIKIKKYLNNKCSLNKTNQILSKQCQNQMKEQLFGIQREQQLMSTTRYFKNKSNEFDDNINQNSFQKSILKSPSKLRSCTTDVSQSIQQESRSFYDSNINRDGGFNFNNLKEKQRKINNPMDLSFYNLAEKFRVTDCEYYQSKDLFSKTITDSARHKTIQQLPIQRSYSFSKDKLTESTQLLEKIDDSLYDENKEQEDPFVRRAMISMITGKPIKPYLQLISLQQKILDSKTTVKRDRDKIKIFDESKLKNLHEFRNFLFPQNPTTIAPNYHSNLSSHSPAFNSNNNSYKNLSNNENRIQQSPDINSRRASDFKLISMLTTLEDNNININDSSQQNKPRSTSLRTNQDYRIRTNKKPEMIIQFKEKLKETSFEENQISSPKSPKKGGNPKFKRDAITSLNRIREFSYQPDKQKKEEISAMNRNKRDNLNFTSKNRSITDNSENPISFANKSLDKSTFGETFSVNLKIGKFTHLLKRLKYLLQFNHLPKRIRCTTSFENNSWEKMREIENEIENSDSIFYKRQLRRENQVLGTRQVMKLLQRTKLEEEDRAIKFEKLVEKTQYLEGKLIDQFEDFSIMKKKKNEEFKGLMDTQERDRPLTRQLRKKNYEQNPEGIQQMKKKKDREEDDQKNNLTLRDMRLNAEEERKLIIEQNEKQVEWYTQSVNQLCIQSQCIEEDMSICTRLMDAAKQQLEDGQSLQLNHFEKILCSVESSPSPQYNQMTITCLYYILELLSIHINDLSHLPKLQSAYTSYLPLLIQQQQQQKNKKQKQ